jgi:hypothetical protein
MQLLDCRWEHEFLKMSKCEVSLEVTLIVARLGASVEYVVTRSKKGLSLSSR